MTPRILLAVALATTTLAVSPTLADESTPAGIPWAKTYADALKQARQDKKLVMVDVYTEWCSWCKVLDKETYPDAKVVKAAEPFVGVKLDAEAKGEGEAFAAKYKVQAFPTILFLDPAGADDDAKVVATVMGFLPPAPFAEKLGTILAAYRELPVMEKRLVEKPEDLEALGKLAAIRSSRQEDDAAHELLDRGLKIDPDNAQGQLTKALNAVGDRYQETQKFDEAIPLFRKAAKSAKTPDDASYAQSSVAMCFLSQDKLKEAIPELEAVDKIPGAPEETKEQASLMLRRIHAAMEKAKTGDEKKTDEPKDKEKSETR